MKGNRLPKFDDTAQAFKHMSDRDLFRAKALFSLLAHPFLVAVGSILARIALALRIPIAWALKPTVYAQFCGGESILDSEKTIAILDSNRVRTILDYSAEGKSLEKALDSTCSEILATIEAAKDDSRHSFSVFKVSGLSTNKLLKRKGRNKQLIPNDQAAWERVERRVRAICAATAEAGGRVLIDAEESWLQNAIDGLAEDMMNDFNRERAIVFTTVQLYRHDRLDYIKKLTKDARENEIFVGLKIVRGAYMEKERERAKEKGYPSPIQLDKETTDRDFNFAIKFCLDNIDIINLFAGSHNEASNLYLCEEMEVRSIDPSDKRICFSQLLGMSDTITFNLAAQGYNVSKYVPYGPIREAMPYLTRRAQENTSVAGQTLRELELLKHEIDRRQAL